MKLNLAKKLAIGFSVGISATIPAVFATSCFEQPEKEKEYQDFEILNSYDVQTLVKHHLTQIYPKWDSEEWTHDNVPHNLISDWYKPHIDPSMYHRGICIRIQQEESTEFPSQLILDPQVYNLKNSHPEFTFRIIGRNEGSCDPDIAQKITIPAYDGLGKSIGNWKYEGSSTKHLIYPWLSLFAEDTQSYECFGPWHLDKTSMSHYPYILEDVLCSTRIISLPNNTSHIHEDAFNLEKEISIPIYSSATTRPIASKTFREWVFGTETNPDGLWCKLQFEGDVVPKENIGQGAFYHCWSLEQSLATYYGAETAHSMVFNGTH